MNLNTTDFNTIEAYLKSTDKSESIITLHNTLIAFNRMKIFTGRLTEAKELPYDRENLSNAVYSTLTKLHDLGESNMGKLSEVLGFTASKTTRCVDALIKKDLRKGDTTKITVGSSSSVLPKRALLSPKKTIS